MLPCKPDNAVRTVELAGAPLALSLLSCDADGATFAVSYATLTDPARAGGTGAWRCRHAGAALAWRCLPPTRLLPALLRMRRSGPLCPQAPWRCPRPCAPRCRASWPDGTAVTAHAAWFARALGSEVRVATRWCLPTKRGLPLARHAFRRAGTALNPPTALAADLGGWLGVQRCAFTWGVQQPRAIMLGKPPTHEHQHPSHCPRPLAHALRECALHVFAGRRRDRTGHALHRPPEQTKECARPFARARQQSTLVLTDVFGATPCNVAQRLVDE